jgi:hypothetical protein
VDQEVVENIMHLYGIEEDMSFSNHYLHRSDFPALDKWMTKHSYRQAMVLAHHYPEVMDKEK